MNKRGMSTVVTTVLIVLIVIIAVGIVWSAISSFLSGTKEEANTGSCLSTALHILSCSINQTSNVTTVSIFRPSGNAKLDEINFVFYTSKFQNKFSRTSSLPDELETATFSFTSPEIVYANYVDVSTVIGGQTCQLTGLPIGCSYGARASISIPIASFTTAPESGSAPLQVIFDASNSYDPLNNITDYSWSFGDGINSTGITTSHIYGLIGNYTAELTITNGQGQKSTASKIISVTPNNLKFSFGNTGYLAELNWTNSSGVVKRVVWDELSGRYNGCTVYGCGGARYYLHSSLGDYGLLGYWSYNKSGIVTSVGHSGLTYTKTSQTSNSAVIEVDETSIHATDTWKFEEDSVKINITLKNKLNQKLTKVNIPIYFGGLIVGDYDSNYRLNDAQTGMSRLIPLLGGTVEGNFNSNGGVRYFYPEITDFSPVHVLWDSRITIGQQFLTPIYAPDQIALMEKFRLEYTPTMYSEIHTDLAPLESKSYTLVFKIADGNKWQSSLQPYKDWFTLNYGTTPSYCPTGPVDGFVASNAGPAFWNQTTNRYKPGSTLRGLTNADNLPTNTPGNTRLVMQQLGLNLFGLWQTPLVSSCLVGNKTNLNLNSAQAIADCSRQPISRGGTGVPQCIATGNDDICEFGAHTEFIDPNIDAGPNRSKINDFTDAYAQNNIDVFWYVRPCADIYGINVNYSTNTVTQGMPTGYADLDLRNTTNRDKQYGRVFDLANRGVNGFYFDATGCPGDEDFFDYVKTNLESSFPERKFFYMTEGARDRLAVKIPQAPLLKLPYYSYNSSQLLFWLVPQATYYGGIFNSPLNTSLANNEFGDIMNKGYQAIPLNFAPDLGIGNLQSDGRDLGNTICELINQSYANRYSRYMSYGQSMGCDPVPQTPPWPNYPTCPI